ncbi:LPS export ABC transporter periplasmic protein LptC [bacterium]|nr:LPS export ABC transporter periplasmic protein LptC [bacterium]MBU1025247.1 LPS export ABC transporter periplasmic protein LptC [bacterium]
MKYSYGIFWIIVMTLAGWITYFAVVNQPDGDIEYKNRKSPDKEIGSISARTIRLEEVGADGTIRWILESVDLNGTIEGSFTMTQPRAQIQVRDNMSLTLTAPMGSYDSPAGTVHFTDGVEVIREDDNSRFWADEIIFRSKEKLLESDGGDIKLSHGNWEFHATKISVDLSYEQPVINLSKPVKLVSYKETE